MSSAKKASPVEGPSSGPSRPAADRYMPGPEFARLRAALGKSQRELAELLGLSQKAIESYEQGWRNVPAHVERMLYFLLFKLNDAAIADAEPCWESTGCPEERRESCVAYVAREGRFCWFFTGKLCAIAKGAAEGAAGGGDPGGRGCYTCSVFSRLRDEIEGKGGKCR
jgi:DNA-binding XRE family transcriptional regulator